MELNWILAMATVDPTNQEYRRVEDDMTNESVSSGRSPSGLANTLDAAQ